MKITSMDISNKEFKRVFRGFDCDEVDEFLNKIAEDYETIYKENSSLKEKLATINEKVDHYSKIEDTIQNTLLLAQNAAEQAKLSAQKESEMIIRNANDSAQRILDKAHNDVVKVNEEFERTKEEFIKFRTKFRNFMNSQLEMFETLEKEFISNYSISNTIDENIEEKEIENFSEFKIKDINDDPVSDDLSEIKSFFAKE